MKAHILVVDDELNIRESVKDILEDEGYTVSLAENGQAARRTLETLRPELIMLDIWMPDLDGISLLREIVHERGLQCPVIMMSGHGTVETAVEATRLGAADFIEKPLSLAKLLSTVEKVLAGGWVAPVRAAAAEPVPLREPVGKSLVMQNLRAQLERLAEHATPLLLMGEPGSGKAFCARYIHACGSRRAGAFVDTRSLQFDEPQSLSSLFGEEHGGEVRPGRIEQAQGGTLLIDDVAELTDQAQSRLVSLLDTGEYLRVNGRHPIRCQNVRLIAATRYPLEHEVHAGRFREDLFHLLNVVPVPIPPLRDHSEDVPELLQDHINRFTERDGLGYRSFTVAAQNRLRNHSWTGNIRELGNLVRRLLISGTHPEISLEEVEAILERRNQISPDDMLEFDLPLRQAREQFEKAYLEFHLRDTGGSVGKVAKRAGMERTHLYRKMRALGIDAKQLGKE